MIPKDPIFISSKSNRLSPTGIEERFRKYVKKAGLDGKGYTIHKLRHADLNSTKIYTHTDMSHLRKEATKFPLVLK